MFKAIFVTAVLFVIQMIMIINASENNQTVDQGNSNTASSDASVANDNKQNGTLNG